MSRSGGHPRKVSDDLPDSGETGVRPPSPASLPRPALWPRGARDAPFRGAAEDTATPPGPGRRKVAWVAVALMLVGAVCLGAAVAFRSWLPAGVGVVVGLVGVVVAWRVRIMQDVSISDSPHGPA